MFMDFGNIVHWCISNTRNFIADVISHKQDAGGFPYGLAIRRRYYR